MQGRIVYFGLGALAGVGVGAGYWRGYHKLNLSDIPQSQPGRPADSPPQDLLCKLATWIFPPLTWPCLPCPFMCSRYGSPKPPFSRHNYTSHSVLYDHVRKVPLWSAEVITSQRISGSANRRNSKFQVRWSGAPACVYLCILYIQPYTYQTWLCMYVHWSFFC